MVKNHVEIAQTQSKPSQNNSKSFKTSKMRFPLGFHMKFALAEPFTGSKIGLILHNFRPFLNSFVSHASCGHKIVSCSHKIASTSPQVGLLEPIWRQVGPKLAPSWPQVGSIQPNFGLSWLRVGLQLATRSLETKSDPKMRPK